MAENAKKKKSGSKKATKNMHKKQKKEKSVSDNGSVLEERFDQFSEEVERIGERFENKMKKDENRFEEWFKSTFGIVGPLISSLFGITIIGIFIWWISLLNFPLGNVFFSNLGYFLTDKIGLFFMLFLFFSYTSYFSKKYPRLYMPFSPLAAAMGITVGFWLVMHAITIANISFASSRLTELAISINNNLIWLFWFVLGVGYLLLLIKYTSGNTVKDLCIAKKVRRMKKNNKEEVRRLYRSGDDKILGGVCGGIGEYIGIDPVVVRFIWILLTLAYGTGIWIYIIMWIIMPRNPDHKWDD